MLTRKDIFTISESKFKFCLMTTLKVGETRNSRNTSLDRLLAVSTISFTFTELAVTLRIAGALSTFKSAITISTNICIGYLNKLEKERIYKRDTLKEKFYFILKFFL